MKNFSKKGFEIASWTFIEIVLVCIVAVVVGYLIYHNLNAVSESSNVQKNARLLTEAINKVYERCDKENICSQENNETVEIRLPQKKVGINMFSFHTGWGDDTHWLLYFGYKGSEIDNELGGQSQIGKLGDYCNHKICSGFYERKIKEEEMPYEYLSGASNVTPFWFVSPCYANVTVYYSSGKINLCFKDFPSETPEGSDNFCHGTLWPQHPTIIHKGHLKRCP